MSETQMPDEIYVLTLPEEEATTGLRGEPARGWPDVATRLRPTHLRLDELADNFRLFIQQMDTLLGDISTHLGEFEFAEVEVSAGITAGGKLTLMGAIGAEAGVEGGLKFVFKKRSAQS